MRDWDKSIQAYMSMWRYKWITLPMRDWDNKVSVIFRFCETFKGLHYLWGIETSRVPPRAKKVQICAASDYITYERLRHNSCSIFNEVFWIVTGLHYLWEIETFLLMKVLLSLIYGLHYLWGIETFRKCLLHLLLTFAGLHYLRGIETYRILLLDFQ